MPLVNKISVDPKYGLIKTIEIMNRLEQLSFNNPEFVKWVKKNFSTDCKSCIPGKVWSYIQNNFKYISDDPFDEIITAPYILLKTKQGDCDDFSLFVKTILDIVGGFNSRYILFSKTKNNFSHIAVYCDRGNINNLSIDPVIIDGANNRFNDTLKNYNYYTILN